MMIIFRSLHPNSGHALTSQHAVQDFDRPGWPIVTANLRQQGLKPNGNGQQ